MGISKGNGTQTAEELRRRAEERLRAKEAQRQARSDEALQRVVHELEVHQIELEMQNEELQQARDEAVIALERYADLYDFAPVGYFTLDHAGAIKAVNLKGASLIGIERAKLMGRRFEAFLPGDDRPLFTAFLGKVLAGREKDSVEVAFLTEAKQPLFVQLEAVTDTSGEECRLAVIDITRRRRAELELAENKLQLESVNRSLEEAIATAVEELRHKDQMLILQDRLSIMGEMINNIAHQWNQPLNTLGMLVQQLPFFYDAGGLSREVLTENTEKCMNLVHFMAKTIQDFTNLFKTDKKPIAFGVDQVIRRTLSLIEKTFHDHRIDLVLDLHGDHFATGFPNEYSQVLLNILLNARDALVQREVADPLIAIRSFAEEGRSVVTITDNAGGIPEGIVDRIFDAYFSTKGDKGTGIGLFMSKTIIETSMGGRLTVRNVGGGAEFRIEV